MGMSTHIKAFIPDNDPEYLKHKKILLACLDAGVSLPKESAEYFVSPMPYLGLLDEVLEVGLKEGEHYKEYQTESSNGFEIDITKLPPGTTRIRFYNSY